MKCDETKMFNRSFFLNEFMNDLFIQNSRFRNVCKGKGYRLMKCQLWTRYIINNWSWSIPRQIKQWIMHVFTYILGNQYQACMTLKKYLKLFSSRNFQCSIRRILLDATSALPSWILSHKLVICRFKFLKFKPLAKSCKIKFIASHFKTVSCVVDEIYNLFNIYVQTRVAGYSQWNLEHRLHRNCNV